MADVSLFEEAAATAPVSSDKLEALLDMGARAIDLEQSVKDMEEIVKVQKAALNDLKTKLLPEAMMELGLPAFRTRGGASIEINDFVAGSIPKDEEKRQAALTELIAEGGQELIKTEISIAFAKSEHNIALDLAAELASRGIDYSMNEGVHPQSLCAFVRDRLRSGDEVKAEILGCFVGKTAKIKMASDAVKTRTRKAE